MEQDIIGKHRNFGKAVIALAKGLPGYSENNSHITEGNIIHDAKKEFCKTPEDVKKARTTAKLIAITEQRSGEILNIEKPNIPAISVFAKLVFNVPMTIKERNYLLGFLHDDKSKKIAQDILSKLKLLQGDENSEFIQSFLKNKDGKLDISLFVQYLINELNKYKLIIPDGAEGVKEIKNGNNKQGVKYFEYEIDSKIQICAVSEGEIFLLDKKFESVRLLNNGMIFGVENIFIVIRPSPSFYNEKTGYLYKFYDKKGISEIYGMLGLIDIDIISLLSSESSTVFEKRVENGKKGLMELTEQDKEKRIWEEKILLPNINDNIMITGKFITTVNHVKKDTGENTVKYDTYIKNPYGLNMIANSYSNEYFEVEDLGNNLISIETDKGQSIYKFNEKENKLEIIDSALINMYLIEIDDFLNGNPVVITKENGISGVYIFDEKIGKLNILIFGGDGYIIEEDQINSKVENKHFVHYWKDGVLYKLKKGYKYNHNYLASRIKKGFFGDHIYLESDFESAQEYLEAINVSELPIAL